MKKLKYRKWIIGLYFVGDFDKQCKHDENEQVVEDADNSDDDVDDLEWVRE